MDIDSKLTCGTYQMCFTVTGGTVTSYNWEIKNAIGEISNSRLQIHVMISNNQENLKYMLKLKWKDAME